MNVVNLWAIFNPYTLLIKYLYFYLITSPHVLSHFRLKTPLPAVPSSTRWWRCMTILLRARKTWSSVKGKPSTSWVKVRPLTGQSSYRMSDWMESCLHIFTFKILIPSFLVNEEWLEGHCAGNIGIFPSCFAYRENANITEASEL